MRQQARHTPGQRIFRIGLIVFLTLLYAVVIPLHHHDDMVEHADCILCQLSYMAAMIVTVFICLFCAGFVVSIQHRRYGLYLKKCLVTFSTRAPPAF